MAETYADLTVKPIPMDCGVVSGWRDIPLRPNDEPLVALGQLSMYPNIVTDSIYFGERLSSPYPTASLDGSLITHFVRQSVADMLLKAQDLLPANLRLVTFDAYRQLAVQQSLYETYLAGLRQQNRSWGDERLSVETQKYVSLPSHDPQRPSPHNTGGSVDIALIEMPQGLTDAIEENNGDLSSYLHDSIIRQARPITFGTSFDHGGPEAALTYYERLAATRHLTDNERIAQYNRRLLYRVMVEAGLQPYSEEWWHFNAPQSQMGAQTDGRKQASFGAVELTNENLHHEYMRKQHHAEALMRYLDGSSTVNPLWTRIGRAAILTPTLRTPAST